MTRDNLFTNPFMSTLTYSYSNISKQPSSLLALLEESVRELQLSFFSNVD